MKGYTSMKRVPRQTVPDAHYLTVVGDSWALAQEWIHCRPDIPFVGVRVDGEEVWVLVQPKTASGPVCPAALSEIKALLLKSDPMTWCDEEVVICQARTRGDGHRLARQVVEILRRTPDTSG